MTHENERHGSRGSRAAGSAVWAISWLFALAAVCLALVFQLPRTPLPGMVLSSAPGELRELFPVIGFTVAIVYGPVAALLLLRRVNAVGVILAVHAVGSALGCFGSQWALLGAQAPGLPLWGLLAFASGWSYIPGTFMTAVLPILVTHARIPAWQTRLVHAGIVNAVIGTAAGMLQQSVASPRNPLAPPAEWLQQMLPSVYLLTSFIAVGLAWVSAGVLIGRWVRARGRGRTGLAWLTLGHVFLSASYTVLVIPASESLPHSLLSVGLLTPVLGQVIYPAAILVVVLGQGLWGQGVVVSRIILWALLTVSGVALYFAIVLAAPLILPWPEGLRYAVPLLIAVAIEPTRGWFQRRIDQLVYGTGADPATLLSELSEQIGELEAGPAGLRELCEAIRRVLRLASVEVHMSEPALTLGAGRLVGEPVRIALPGERDAFLIVSAPGGQRLDRRSLSVLRDVSGLVAASLNLLESERELGAVREGLLEKRALERRRIQRELHDGLGPALAGLGFGLAAASNLLGSNPRGAELLLSELEEDLGRRARAVRRLAHEVLPSPLEGMALPLALSELAERFQSDGLLVRSEVRVSDASQQLPQSHQDAMYLIAAEALTNSARHSGASEVGISLEVDEHGAVLRVADNGSGLPSDYRPGVGLASLRRRAAELGGSLTLESSNGTRVTVVLPRQAAGSSDETEAGGPDEAGQSPVASGHRDRQNRVQG